MKIIYNNIIPFNGFKAINIFGILFVRGTTISQLTVQHEQIHTLQMKELGYALFYIIYVIEWLIKLFLYLDFKQAYKNISFEKEAYMFENDIDYVYGKDVRTKYNWRYLI